MNEELFKQNIINIINTNQQNLSMGCIYYILKDILNQVEIEYKTLAEQEYQNYLKQKQKEKEEEEEK